MGSDVTAIVERRLAGRWVLLDRDGGPIDDGADWDDRWRARRGWRRSYHEHALLGLEGAVEVVVEPIVPIRPLPSDLSGAGRALLRDQGSVCSPSWCTARELAGVDWARPERWTTPVWFDEEDERGWNVPLDAEQLRRVQAACDVGAAPEALDGRALLFGTSEPAVYELGDPDSLIVSWRSLGDTAPNLHALSLTADALAQGLPDDLRVVFWFDQPHGLVERIVRTADL